MSDYPFSRILLATEHTEFDVGAERLAFVMSQRCGVPLRAILPIHSNPEYEAEMPQAALRAEREAAAKIADLHAQAHALGVMLDVEVRRGSELHELIVTEAKQSNTDLIVIRRRGKQGFFSRMLVGEMVSRVIRDASCAVLLVPRNAQFWRQRICCAIGDTPEAAGIVKTAGLIAQICDLPLTVLSVAPDQAAMSKISQFNAQSVAMLASDNVSGEIRMGKPAAQTQLAVRESGADLVVIGRQRYQKVAFGSASIMNEIAGSMDVPTLVTPV